MLVGHTHTYERFIATRKDGRGFQVVNLSGRPESRFLWFGSAGRSAEAIPRGGEEAWLEKRGWRDLDGWDVSQPEAMTKDETDEFALFRVEPDGGVTMSIRYMNRPGLMPSARLLGGGPP